MFLAEVTLETSWWLLKKGYDVGYYMIYGEQETKEDRILKQIEELKKQKDEEIQMIKENNEKFMSQTMMDMYRQFALEKNYYKEGPLKE